MPSQITNYQCPACTGPLHFSSSSGKLECDYCGSVYTVAEIEDLYNKKDEAAAAAHEHAEQAAQQQAAQAQQFAQEMGADEGVWDDSAAQSWGDDAQNMRVYNCPSCGAELICDQTTAATSCPYCGNPTIIPGQLSGGIKPDLIIPFKLDHNAAVAALKNHYKKKRFLPSAFAEANHVEQIQGVYVPFWLFDGWGDTDMTFHATRSTSYRQGNYQVTDTQHFDIHRSGTVHFEKIPVDASTKMPDGNMDSIEPFDYSQLVEYSNAYLPGYLADRFDVSVEDSAARADRRCRASCIEVISGTVQGYMTCTTTSANVRLHRGQVKYALLPVWMLHTKYNGQDYLFSMNGQTGKLTGDLPVSWGKFWLWFGGIFAGCAAILALLLH